MAHQQQIDFCKSVKEVFPSFFKRRLVLDIGSLDINGNNQYLFEDCHYLGIDLHLGRNVDLASRGHELGLPDASVDVIVSTECFEHDCFYDLTLRNIVRMLKPGGLFLFSCATTGRPEHGTRRTTPADAPFIQELGEWGDYYRNLDESDIRAAIDIDLIFGRFAFSTNLQTCDLYFWGVKKGALEERSDYSFLIHQDELRLKALKLEKTVSDRESQIAQLQAEATKQSSRMAQLEYRLSRTESQSASLQQLVAESESRLANVLMSRSWRVTKPLRVAGRLARGEFDVVMASLEQGRFRRVATTIRQVRNAMRYVLRGDFTGLRDRLRARRRDAAFVNITSAFDASGKKTWGIMTPPHTIYLAHLIAEQLKRHGWGVHIMTEAPISFHCDWYVVLCPQIFHRLPPGEKRVVYQLEQSVSSRWFTAEYFKTLNESLAVLDYSLKNIGFLEGKGIGYPHVFYLPIGASDSYGQIVGQQEKTCDVLFYGDSNSSPRRRQMLAALRQHFDVRVANELFGQDMLAAIKQARVVINLHYYEHALLEMPRIQECLSLGVPVVSESAQDQGDYPELHSAVRFFEEGSIPAMLSAVRLALDRPISVEEMREAASVGARRFDFMFDRLLVGMGFLPSSHVRHMQLPIPINADRIALSLPETISRRKVFEASKPNACFVFDGMRRQPGWIGCGLSYLALAQHALAAGKSSLTVMEDDVILPLDFEEKLTVIREYLEARPGQWDVFAGVIASLHPDCSVLSVEVFKDITFVTIDKMTSMVFNIYSDGFLRLLKSWDPENIDAASNTIDRFIESSANLRVVVVLPYFVGHREEVHSTLWGFQNIQYRDMIAESQATLYRKVLALQESQHCLTAD